MHFKYGGGKNSTYKTVRVAGYLKDIVLRSKYMSIDSKVRTSNNVDVLS